MNRRDLINRRENERMARAGREATIAAQRATAAFAELAERMKAFGRAVSDASWSMYRAAGMPYGETHEGLCRWFRQEHRRQDAAFRMRVLGAA